MPQCTGRISQGGIITPCPNRIPQPRGVGMFAPLRCPACQAGPQPRIIAPPAPLGPFHHPPLPPGPAAAGGVRGGTLGDPAVRSVVSEMVDGYKDICSICMEPTVGGAPVWFLPCKHVFHRQCLDSYMRTFSAEETGHGRVGMNQNAPKCPNCRKSFRSSV